MITALEVILAPAVFVKVDVVETAVVVAVIVIVSAVTALVVIATAVVVVVYLSVSLSVSVCPLIALLTGVSDHSFPVLCSEC